MDDRSGLRAGGHDWLATWSAMYDAERAQGEAATDPEFARHADQWAERAGRFAASSRRVAQPDGFMAWLTPRLRPSDRLLDVGAGTGRYLPYLARHVAEVVAVEPSPAMCEQLERTVATAGLTNVVLRQEFWPPQEPLAADVVISAHVVYGVRAIGPFLLGLDRAATRLCALSLGLRHPSWTIAPFWERIHGQPRLPLPAALETLNACHQLGLPARLELIPAAASFQFADAAEALVELRGRLRVTASPERDVMITTAISELLAPTPDGMLGPRTPQREAAIVWWEVQHNNQERICV